MPSIPVCIHFICHCNLQDSSCHLASPSMVSSLVSGTGPCSQRQWVTLCPPSCQDRDNAAQMHRMLPPATPVPRIWATVLLKLISGPQCGGVGCHLEDGDIPQAQPVSPVSSVCSECSTARLALLQGLQMHKVSPGDGHGDHGDMGTMCHPCPPGWEIPQLLQSLEKAGTVPTGADWAGGGTILVCCSWSRLGS